MRSGTRAFLLLLLLPLALRAAEPVTYTTAPLDFVTKGGTVHFTVEEALTDTQHENGLMFRKAVPDKQGMIFVFTPARQVNFWMKNTLIPLDMVFVSAQGMVTRVTANAAPESTALIPSPLQTRAVIELGGGGAARYHIAPGDRVVYAVFP